MARIAPGQRFAIIPASALDDPRLTSRDLLAYMALARHADGAGVCWPSVRTISHTARVSVRTVQMALRDLERYGFIEVVPRTDERGDPAPNRYRLTDRGGGAAVAPPGAAVAPGVVQQLHHHEEQYQSEQNPPTPLSGSGVRKRRAAAVASDAGLRNWIEHNGRSMRPDDEPEWVREELTRMVASEDVGAVLALELVEAGFRAWEAARANQGHLTPAKEAG